MNTNKFVVDKESTIVSLDNLKFSNPPPTYGAVVSYNKVRLGPEFTTTPDQKIFTFNVAPNSDVMIDMRSFKIYSKIKLTHKNGDPLTKGAVTIQATQNTTERLNMAHKDCVAPIQNLGLAMFSACRLMYRAASLVDIPANMHKINLALSKLHKNEDDFNTKYAASFHYKEEPNTINTNLSKSFYARFDEVVDNRVVEIITPLEYDFFACPLFLSGMHGIHLTLQRTPLREILENYMPHGSKEQMNQAIANLDNFKMEITDCTLEYTEYSLSASAMEAIRSKYMKPDTPMKYPVTKGSLQIHPINAQTMEAPNINLGVNRVPRTILVWAYNRAAYNGQPHSNLNNLKHFKFESIRVKCDGRLIPQNMVKGHFTPGGSAMPLYEQLLECVGPHAVPKLSYNEFRYYGSTILGIQCGQVPSQFDTQFSKSDDRRTYALHSNSNIQLDVRFAEPLDEEIVLCVYLMTEHQYNIYLPNCLVSVDSSAA